MRSDVLLLLAAGLLCLLPVSAWAQFAGPAIGASTPVNLPVTITTDPAILYPPEREVIIDNGDTLGIHLFASPDYTPTARVGLDGQVELPLIGVIHIAGLTIPQAQQLIAHKLVDAGMYRDPQVSIQLLESPGRTATVTGELHGIVPIIGRRRLLDVLSSVGGGSSGGLGTTVIVSGGAGLPTTASHVITIIRPGVPEPINVDLGIDPAKSAQANVPIFAGDTIVVSRVGVVYVVGAFKNQGAIPLQQNAPLTLMKVASLAGGPGFEGKAGDLRIIRTVGLERQEVRVDMNKVFKGQAPDPVLQAEDIIFLPSNAMKAAIKSGGLSTLLGLASVLVVAIQQ
jgi:polysaccharide export outer membrane protein